MNADRETERTKHLERIEDLATCRRNADTLAAENAARNLIQDRPAYWSSAGGGDAAGASTYLAAEATHSGSLLAVLISRAGFYKVRSMGPQEIAGLLDFLIPLNMAAVEELEHCYLMQGTFRERDELLGREEAAVLKPFWPSYPEAETVTSMYRADYAAAQVRFFDRLADAHVAGLRTASEVMAEVQAGTARLREDRARKAGEA